MVLMLVMLVPMNLGLTATQIGRARAELQAASQTTLSQMDKELRRAVYVFPNAQTPGVTDGAPYSNNGNKPYVQVSDMLLYDSFANGVCQNGTSVNNTSRIDFLLPKTEANGTVSTPVENADYLVTYYARRLYAPPANDVSSDYYDEFENPIVLFRAQVPYRDGDGYPLDTNFQPINPATQTTARNALIDSTRYTTSCGTNSNNINRGARWLTQNSFGEPNLEPLTETANGAAALGSHTLITPRGMGLVAPYAAVATDSGTPIPTRSFQPTTSFTCDDTDGNGAIDRVTINLELSQYDSGGAAAKAQRVRTSLAVDLPNIR
jgi:hypothetical protein